ncbi:MAG: four helix bundle protein [Chloroflexota bacterium]|nr:four helix bundle protein [Lentimicrobium sp.]
MTIEKFEDLEIWQLAHELTKDVFNITNREVFKKDFRFRDQIRASAGSIMDNIAEGFERGGNKEFAQFLYIAKGSCGETRSQLYRSHTFEYIEEDELIPLIKLALRLNVKISNMITYLKNSELKGAKFH